MTVKPRAFTLVELMITLVIVAILLSAGLITMRGYIPKQRLLSTVSGLENLLSRAQSEATARSHWTCIKFSTSGPLTAELWVDENSNHAGNLCGDSAAPAADILISSLPFKPDIDFASCSGTPANVDRTCIIWFDNTGSPKLCAACQSVSTTACVDHSFQIILKNPNLEATARAREIEALSGGLIQTVKPGEKGLVGTSGAGAIFARIPPVLSDAGACE
ncbi:MAG TPA: type II secretion system protein [Bdellovibrionota bacterium]|nr:type II secretion system protein [Bdellovibrionota bacterium]